MGAVEIDGSSLTIEDAVAISRGIVQVQLSDEARDNMRRSKSAVDSIIESNEVVYGINTGFGAMSSVTVGKDELEDLQKNLIRSHACGVGKNMEPEQVLLMMLFRANSLSKGVSGTRPEVVALMISMINLRIAPVVPRIGSLGASGDLAPLSHMALSMIGEGECSVYSKSGWGNFPSLEALENMGLKPLVLEAKEGLSLINGTSQMCAYLALSVLNLESLVMAADFAVACSLESIRGLHAPFDKRIHQVRPHIGQNISAARIRELLANSSIAKVPTSRVQDAYCFRCSPQVHGPVIDMIENTRKMLEIEINSATDNPLVFVNGDDVEIVSGGNFHGQNLGLASDILAMACHELGSISERRINKIMDPKLTGFGAFLANKEGLESGLMIVHYVAAALTSELHLLSNPTTTYNVPVSLDKEDHVSMGATGTYRALKSTKLLSQVLANELICASEAIDRISESPGDGVRKIHCWVRNYVNPMDSDRAMTSDCEKISALLIDGDHSSIFR